MNDIKYIKDSNSNKYFLIEESKISKVRLTPTNISGSIGLYRVVGTNIKLDQPNYEFDVITLRGETVYINQPDKEIIAKYDYITDLDLIGRLQRVYKKYLELKSKEPNKDLFIGLEVDEFDYIHISTLTGKDGESDPFVEFSIHSTDPLKRKQRHQ